VRGAGGVGEDDAPGTLEVLGRDSTKVVPLYGTLADCGTLHPALSSKRRRQLWGHPLLVGWNGGQAQRIQWGMATEKAVLGGGCFWCVEAAFLQLEGVEAVRSGYMGGRRPNPTYEQVCTGATGHVEVAEITFDPAKISYRDLLEVFFTAHDPTTLNRQGNDVGEQYRSVIFYLDESQKKTAEEVIAEFTREKVFDRPIVTAVEPAQTFWPAENYHQNYYANNSYQPYCMFTVAPKVKKIRQKFAGRVKAAV